MKFNLRTKLTLSFAATALICVLLIGLLSNMQLEKHFRDYVRQNQEKQNKEIAGLIASKIQPGGQTDAKSIQDLGIFAMEQGLIIQVKDAGGGTIWDAYTYNGGMCRQMIRDMSANMHASYPGWNGELIKQTLPLSQGGSQLGTVDIAYYGPYYYNDADTHFIKTLNGIFIAVGLFSLLLALAFGALLSRRISMPISRVIHIAQSIGKGTYGARIHEKFSTTEIDQLSETVNQLAESLESQEKLRRRLTGDVAHELRTPLATLQTHLETMIDGIWEPTTQRLESCHEEILRITRLVSDLEKLARYESDTLQLDRTEFPADEFLARLLRSFETTLALQGVSTTIDSDGCVFFADRDKLSQVVINLIANALKFTPAGGSITFISRQLTAGAQMTVSDTGAGIPPDDLPHVFERFYRSDMSRNRTTGGSGIGLTLVKAIVEAHGGIVTISSEVGKGTAVSFLIPNHAG
jgi:two-component system, OmpR family, sensor histidine kinase BaeS